jgi:hypothetical protein
MILRAAIFNALQALSCLVFALALVLSPASAAHAHDGSHAAHPSAPSQAKHDHSCSLLGHDKAGVVDLSAAQADKDTAGKCCSGICLTVVLSDTLHMSASTKPHGHEPSVVRCLFAFDPVGFLRPPKHLI